MVSCAGSAYRAGRQMLMLSCTGIHSSDAVHGDAALSEQFLDVPAGQAIAQVPANCERDHFGRKLEASEHR
jgi:hypothetical protein